jgi:FecR protein
MRNTAILVAAFLALSFFDGGISSAAPLTEAHVTKIINQVKLIDPVSGDRDAKLDDVVRGDLALITGIKSRSELLFQDNTLTRLGPESYFSFKSGTRDMTLQKGTMLLQVPKGLGGAKIHSASITATITGTTIMMEYVPQREIKILVLEGTLRLSMNGRFGDSLLMTPGKMVIMSPNARRVPDPITVDLKKVVHTSTLVNMGEKHAKQASGDTSTLPSIKSIEKEVDRQQSGKDRHRLVDTNLVILGKGTTVVLGSDNLMADLAVRNDVANIAASLVPSPKPEVTLPPTPNPTPNPAPTPNPNPPPNGAPPPPPPGVYLTDNTTTIATQSASASITTQGVAYSGVIYKDLTTNGSPSGFLFAGPSAFDNESDFDNFYLKQFKQSAVFTFDSLQLGGGITFSLNGGTNSVALVGNTGITNSPATVVNLGGIQKILFATQAGNITLDSGITFTPSADNSKPQMVMFYARGGDLNIGSTFNLPHANMEFAAEDNAIFGNTTSITASNLVITGLQSVQFDGTANLAQDPAVFQLNGGAVEMGGTVTAKVGYLYGSSAVVNGTFNGHDLTASVAGDFTLNGTVSLVGDQKFQITAGDTATINGAITGNLTINSKNIDFGTDIAFANNYKAELTATGNIDATGHALSGFDDIVVTGNFVAGSASANSFAIGGTLSGGSISAVNNGTIVANALHVDSVTANNSITVNTSDVAPYATSTISLNAPTISLLAGANLNGQNGTPLLTPGNANNLSISTSNHDFTLGTNVSLNGGDGDVSVNDAGGNGGTLSIAANNLTLNGPISATTGQNSNNSLYGGNGGTVNLTGQNTVTVNNTIQVSSSDGNLRRSASGGNINIKSNAKAGTAISVTSSAQLLALLDAAAPGPGGSIKFTSAGGAINMSGTAQADRGTIEITNNGTVGGTINLTNATLMADTIKVGALASNGTLNISGGTISADTLLKLYAGGSSGTIDFIDNVTLSGNSAKIIAANTVIINNGKIVTILGPSAADIFTNNPKYTGFGGNGSTTGTFAGKGANTHPFSAAPHY